MGVAGDDRPRSPSATALGRLMRLRARERWLRRALWAWCAVLLAWLLPIGSWSATELPPSQAALAGAVHVSIGVLLVGLHRRASVAAAMRAAIVPEPEGGSGVDGGPPDQGAVERGPDPDRLVPLAAGALLAAPIVGHLLPTPASVDWLWLLYPIAGLVAAAHWRLRGAALVGLGALGVFLLVEGPLCGWEEFREPEMRAFMVMTAALTVAVPLIAGVYAERLAGSDAERRRAEDQLRAARRAESALRDSEGRYRALVQGASDVITLVDADGARRYVSPSVMRVLGYRPEELIGESFFAGIHPDDVERVIGHFLGALRGADPGPHLEFRINDRDGETRHLEAEITNLLNDPAVGGVVVISRDITERKRHEDELRASEEHFRALIQNASDVIVVLDADSRLRYYSPSVERLLGYQPGDLEGLSLVHLLHPEEIERGVGAYAQVLTRPGFHPPLELRCRHRDGSWRTMEVVANNLTQDARVRGIVLTARDITERKRTADQRSFLAEASALLSGSLDFDTTLSSIARLSVPFLADFCAVALLADGGRIERIASASADPSREAFVDEVRRRFLPDGRPPQRVAEILWSTRSSYFPDGLGDYFRSLTRDERGLAQLDRLGLRSGIVVPLIVRDRTVGMMLFAYAESGRRYTPDDLALAEDLARRAALAVENARLYQELDERKQQLQDLVARLFVAQEEERRRVAYEVHDGLAQVAAAAHQHLQAFAGLYHPRREAAKAEMQRVLDLTQRTVREARRVVAGLRPTVLDDFGLTAALRLEMDALRGDGWDVTFEDSLGPDRLPPVVETALFRVAQEAIANARKHSGDTRLRLRLARADAALRLEVEDFGRGMPSADALSPAGPGERVGLAGMQERVSLLDGRLAIESRPGEGTRVTAEIPTPSPAPIQDPRHDETRGIAGAC